MIKKFKKMISMVLVLLLAFGVIPNPMMGGMVAYALEAPTAPAGTGSLVDPYLIATAGNLLWVQDQVSTALAGPVFSGKYFRQTANIDLAGYNWIAIGMEASSFSGSYDGYGHTISNMTSSGSNMYSGLFGNFEGKGISNLGRST